MRTTLTIDDDVAARLRRLRAQGRPLKEIVNDLLRRGLDASEQAPLRSRRSPTTAVDLGKPALPDVDDVWGVIAAVEGDEHR